MERVGDVDVVPFGQDLDHAIDEGDVERVLAADRGVEGGERGRDGVVGLLQIGQGSPLVEAVVFQKALDLVRVGQVLEERCCRL